MDLPTPVRDPLSHAEFRKLAAAPTTRSRLLMRHAERPKIQEDDPSFGENLGLTEAGRHMAHRCGATLAGITACTLGASPMRRTRLTATLLAAGMGLPGPTIFDAPEAGIAGLWVSDPIRLHAGYVREGSATFTDRYLQDGHAEGYRPIHEGTAVMTDWLTQTDFGAACSVIISHDIFIAAFLQGLGVRTFSSRNWVGYLQGAALVEADGRWQAFYCVPDTTDFANTFVQ